MSRDTCQMEQSLGQGLLEQLERLAWYEYQAGAPCIVHLSALTKINTFRALSSNAALLGCASEWLEYDAVSQLSVEDDNTALSPGRARPSATRIPSTLRPTAMQARASHHPWIDLLPCAQMRDNLLKAFDNHPDLVDEDELCHDIVHVGFGGGPNEVSLIVWGHAWDPNGWEVSSAFLRKWGWLLRGCSDMLKATNYWRGVRGEKPFAFKA